MAAFVIAAYLEMTTLYERILGFKVSLFMTRPGSRSVCEVTWIQLHGELANGEGEGENPHGRHS